MQDQNHCHQAGEETIAKMKYQLWRLSVFLSSKDQPEALNHQVNWNPRDADVDFFWPLKSPVNYSSDSTAQAPLWTCRYP